MVPALRILENDDERMKSTKLLVLNILKINKNNFFPSFWRPHKYLDFTSQYSVAGWMTWSDLTSGESDTETFFVISISWWRLNSEFIEVVVSRQKRGDMCRDWFLLELWNILWVSMILIFSSIMQGRVMKIMIQNEISFWFLSSGYFMTIKFFSNVQDRIKFFFYFSQKISLSFPLHFNFSFISVYGSKLSHSLSHCIMSLTMPLIH